MRTDFVLWGAHPSYCEGTPIKLSGGTEAECRNRQGEYRGGRDHAACWTFAVRPKGEPSGLSRAMPLYSPGVGVGR